MYRSNPAVENVVCFKAAPINAGTFYKNRIDKGIRNLRRESLTYDNYFDNDSIQSVYSKIGAGLINDTIPRIYLGPDLDPNKIAKIIGLNIDSPFVVLTSQSAGAEKSWSTSKFQIVIDWLIENTKFSIIEVGLNPVSRPHSRVIQPRGALPLDQQASILARARFFVGVDSGFSHIANSLNIPSIIVMGKYRHWTNHNPFSGPWAKGQGCKIIRSDESPDKIAAQEIILEIIKILSTDEVIN